MVLKRLGMHTERLSREKKDVRTAATKGSELHITTSTYYQQTVARKYTVYLLVV